MATKYKIYVQTSDRTSDSGTSANVQLQMVGEDGTETKWQKLSNFMKSNFNAGKTDSFSYRCEDIGLPVMIRIKLSNLLSTDEWLCNMITVELEDRRVEFPIYEWMYGTTEIARGEAQLPQKVTNEAVKKMRAEEVENNRAKYPWVEKATDVDEIGWGLPRYVNASTAKELPRIFQRSEVRSKNFLNIGLTGAVKEIFHAVEALSYSPIKTLDDYENLYKLNKLKRQNTAYLDDWYTDEGFGRQILNGITQPCFKRLESVDCLPSECFITSADVEPVLGDGKTLDSEAKAGRIFVIDYLQYFHYVPRVKQSNGKPLECPDCIALFYVNDEEQFLPLAIQLVPRDRGYVFTPMDTDEDWTLAKMYFRCAQGNVHEWISHFLATHAAMEPFGVALFRCLPRAHPLYKLLYPHLRTTMVINTDARKSLITKTALPARGISTSALELTREVYKKFNISQLDLPKELLRLGIFDEWSPPNYYYRDDGLKLWEAIWDYVTNVLGEYYKTDEDVDEDFELQGWAQDVALEGLGWQHGDTKGMPESIGSFDELINLCVSLIFTCSCQHAAVNFGQFENYKFVPNSPLAMRLPPHKRGEGSEERVLNSLPDPIMSAAVITIVYALSDYSPNEKYLGDFPKKLFTEQKILDMQEDFRRDLRRIEAEIRERNEDLEHPYTYLLPSRIPNSIAI